MMIRIGPIGLPETHVYLGLIINIMYTYPGSMKTGTDELITKATDQDNTYMYKRYDTRV